MTVQIRCHYDVLGVPRDADASAIKKAHRRAALIHHPDKNVNKSEDEREGSVDEFKLVQAAYECLSDPVERKWYDEHRDMILRGGIAGNGGAGEGGGDSFVYDVMPFHNAGCYDGYDDDDPDGFYSVYEGAFNRIFQGERDGYVSEGNIDVEKMSNAHLSEVRLGDSASAWEDVLAFYNAWEGFTSCLSFAWEDDYHLNDIREAPNRRIRRLMEDENKKKRKAAKKERVEDVCALVRFVKKRDPRVRVQMAKSLREQAMREIEKKKEAELRKKDILAAKEEWRREAERTMAEQEAADLNAGRIRLADLHDDDYDYGGKRGRKKKGKKKGRQYWNATQDEVVDDEDESTGAFNDAKVPDEDVTINDENDTTILDCDEMKVENVESLLSECDAGEGCAPQQAEPANEVTVDANIEDDLCHGVNDIEIEILDSSGDESSEEEPDSWICEICRKDFKSDKQFENHVRSKKHKDALKKYQIKLRKESNKNAFRDIMDEIEE